MKNIIRLSALGLAGAALININGIHVNAAVLTDKEAIAGVSISLDKYCDSNTTAEDIEKADGAMKVGGMTTLLAVNTAVEDDMKLNLNYDRLGIAVVENYLNIRAKASESSKVVGKLPKNAACNVYKVTKDGWAKIKSGKVTGYVKSEYLTLDEEAEKYALEVGKKVATVETQTLNARFLPSTDASKYTLVPIGEELEVVKENISEKYVKNFITKHFKGDDKELIKNVDQEALLDNLDDWICVAIDNEKVFVAKEFVKLSYELDRAVAVSELNTAGTKEVSSVRAQMVEYAKQFLGNRYVYGGTSLTNGTDCSGFTMRIYQHFAYGIPRDSRSQARYFSSISSSEAKPGDLFFYGNGSSVSHVAMYIGGGQVIHASSAKTGIKISNAFYRTPMKVGRIIHN